MSEFLTAVTLAGLEISTVMLVRNVIVYRARMRRLAEIHDRWTFATHEETLRAYAEFDTQTFDQQLWDFSKWTYGQFYP